MKIDTMEFPSFKEWGITEGDEPMIAAGPCSAESEEQVLETARQLKSLGVKVFRAGIWKPRTQPGSFEGVGETGLPWLKKVKEETGMLTATEVANSRHVDMALKHGVDILWIGARTTANPFAVQEIADSLTGRSIPVMIKNPVNPDLALWLGAIERIVNAGITKVAAIHRGFSNYAKTKYRNPPEWQIPVEMKRRYPTLPIVCDPSHISGKRDILLEVSQKALDLNYNGLLIETHRDPANAWSDAKQQITPEALGQMQQKLVLRTINTDDEVFVHTLEELRANIDKLDDELMQILAERMKVVRTIGKYKKAQNITILQPNRWNELITKNIQMGEQKGLNGKLLESVFRSIHQESINQQTEIMNTPSHAKVND